uniref:Uncharacterized protein n=1 Tax=Romanomermis culicivorax TaxID=13658 RepID=A0A915JGQ7_ROMCU
MEEMSLSKIGRCNTTKFSWLIATLSFKQILTSVKWTTINVHAAVVGKQAGQEAHAGEAVFYVPSQRIMEHKGYDRLTVAIEAGMLENQFSQDKISKGLHFSGHMSSLALFYSDTGICARELLGGAE